MSLAEQQGASVLTGAGWAVKKLAAPPLIAPARQFTFPFAVPGEEEALARGSVWLEVRAEGAGTWLGQCAVGFAGAGTASGLWPLPEADALLACAGGYAYTVQPLAPEKTVLLPPRPAVGIVALPARTVLVTHHALVVREAGGELWTTPRLSWEGVTLIGVEGDALHGTGWNLFDDAEVEFTVDLRSRSVSGGGYSAC